MCSSSTTQQAGTAGPSGGSDERKAPSGIYSAGAPHHHHHPQSPSSHDDGIEALGLATGSADEPTASITSSSSSSSLSTTKSPVARTRAKLIIDGAYLEASIKVAGEGRKGRLDHLVLLSLLEERLEVTFDKKVLFQATPDGQPNHFHRSISHPDGAHVKVVLQPLKARMVTVDMGGMKQSQEILLDKGVDLALALEILEPYDGITSGGASSASGSGGGQSTSAPGLVIITGDGDLQPVIERAERSGHMVVVCGGRKSLSERLHHYVRKGLGQAVWLDDLIEQAWVTPRSASVASSAASVTPVMLGGPAATGRPVGVPEPLSLATIKQTHHLDSPHGPAMHIPVMGSPAAAVHGVGVPPMPPMPGLSPKQKLYRCPQGRFCDKLDEPGHLRALRHPCPKGATCPFAIGRVPNDAERRDHMLSFVHICPKGTSCPRNDIEHCTHFDHPYRRTKARCPDGSNCPYITRGAGSSNSSAREHSRMYRHPCPKGSTCPLLAGKQPSEKKRYHLMDYTHPCHVGCKYSVDKEWAWQHFSDFDHVEDQPGADSRSTTASDEGSVDHVILEGGWNYLDESGGASGAAGGSSFLASPSLEGQPLGHSLFSQDFFKQFPASTGLNDMGSMGSALHHQASSPHPHHGASGAGSAASPMRDLHQHHQHHHQHHHTPQHHRPHVNRQDQIPPSPHSPWRQG